MSKLRLQLIAFDWDGTLANSVDPIIKCKQFLAQKYSLPMPTGSLIKKVLGTDFKQAMKVCFPTAENKLLDLIKCEFQNLMQDNQYQAELFDGVLSILDLLREKGIKLTIATSKSRAELEYSLNYNKLNCFFDYICCGDEYIGKPNPAMLSHLLETYKLSADQCLMVGDTTTDILFAKNAGVPIIGVTFGAHSRDSLSEKKPLALIDHWTQLSPTIDKYFK